MQYIREVIQGRKKKTKFVKIEAHSGIKLNEKADNLAKEGSDMRSDQIISFDPQELINRWGYLKWKEETIDISTNTFMKKLQNIKWISKWIIQNRHQEWLD